jgi:rubrerythrin
VSEEPLTTLQETFARAHGLAIAATTVTEKVSAQVVDAEVRIELDRMQDDARRTRAWCLELGQREPAEVAQELLHRANAADEKSADLAGAWFKAGTGPLEALTFLAMAESGEVATWTALAELVRASDDAELRELVEWALPVQQRHLQVALGAIAKLATAADPAAPRWG